MLINVARLRRALSFVLPGVLIAILLFGVIAPEVSYAKKKGGGGFEGRGGDSGYEVDTPYYVGKWDCLGPCDEDIEGTNLYLVAADIGQGKKKKSADVGVDAVVFVYDADGGPLACQVVNLFGNQTAEVSILDLPKDKNHLDNTIRFSGDSSGTIEILVFQGFTAADEGDSGGNSAPIDFPLGTWSAQTDLQLLDDAGGAPRTRSMVELFPVVLSQNHFEHIQSDFIFSNCTEYPLSAAVAKKRAAANAKRNQ